MKRQTFLLFISFLSFGTTLGQATHPLDPLNADEISSAVTILKASTKFPVAALFSTVVLNEPQKSEVLGFAAGRNFRREAFAIVYDRIKNKTYESVVDLNSKKINSWVEVPGVQPLVFVEEY